MSDPHLTPQGSGSPMLSFPGAGLTPARGRKPPAAVLDSWLFALGWPYAWAVPTPKVAEDPSRASTGLILWQAQRRLLGSTFHCPHVLRWANSLHDEKPLSVPRDAPFHLETCPLTAADALGNAQYSTYSSPQLLGSPCLG